MKKFKRLPYSKLDGLMWYLNFEIPVPCMISFFSEVDMSAAEELRNRHFTLGKRKPTYTALVAKAVAMALREYPYANRRVFEWPFFHRIVCFGDINVSAAVEREHSEMTANPETLYNTDKMSLDDITELLSDFHHSDKSADGRWERTKRLVNRLPGFLSKWLASLPRYSPSLWIEHRGGSVLITSPAKYGVDAIGGFWHWPITFSFGLVRSRCVVKDNKMEIRRTTVLSMIFDRRIMAGAPAARFFHRVTEIMENAVLEMESSIGLAEESRARHDGFAKPDTTTFRSLA